MVNVSLPMTIRHMISKLFSQSCLIDLMSESDCHPVKISQKNAVVHLTVLFCSIIFIKFFLCSFLFRCYLLDKLNVSY